MSNYDRSNRVLANVTTATSIATLADIGTWTLLGPITVARVGALVTVAQTGAAPILSFDLRPTYGSDTGRLAGKVGSVTFPAGGVGLGKTVSVEVRSKVNTGQQIVCAVTGAGGAGTVIPFIEWVTRTENSGNQLGSQLGGATQPSPLQLMRQPMFDGADIGIAVGAGGGALVVVSPGPEVEVDEEEQAEQRRERAEEITVGPRPFPHQAGVLAGLPRANAATLKAYAEQLVAEGERLRVEADRQAQQEDEQAEKDKQAEEERQRVQQEQRDQIEADRERRRTELAARR